MRQEKMKDKRMVTLGVLILVVVTTGCLFGIASAGAQLEPIKLHVPAGAGIVLDLDEDGRVDIGDRAVGRSRLEDPVTGERVGRALFDCLATTPIFIERQLGTWLCTYVLELPDGHINLQGKDPAGVGAHVFAVTGGTGLYRNARGEADELDSESGEEITIHLES